MKEFILSSGSADPAISTQNITPRILFLLCMEHPLTIEKVQQRLLETCLCTIKHDSDSHEVLDSLREIMNSLCSSGVLFRNPDDSFELNREVEVKLRNEIANALARGSRNNPAAMLLRREASNFLSRAGNIREDFQKRVYEALRPEFHDLRSQRAKEIILQIWDDVDHKRVYSSLHSIFDMLPMGLVDFGIPKEKVAFEERFFNKNDEEMAEYVIEQIEDIFARKRHDLEKQCRKEMDKTVPEIVKEFRTFLEDGTR